MTAVVGLDLSMTATGIAYTDGGTSVTKLPSKYGDARLSDITRLCCAACRITPDTLAVIEDLPTHAHGAGITGMVHGAVRCALLNAGIPYVTVVASVLKKYATGKGNCGKPEMAVAAFKRAGVEFADDNQCDAWWLRAMGLDALGSPLFPLPASQRDALSKVEWPAAIEAA